MALAGALEVLLFADVSRIRDDMGKAVGIVSSSSNSMESAVRGVRTALEALGVGLSIAKFTEFVRGAIEAADAVGKLSQRTGIATEALSQLQFAAKISNVSTDALTVGIKKLNVSISEGLSGDAKKVELFKNLGISLRDASGNAKTADKVLLEMAGSFSAAKDGATKTAYAVSLMGKAGDEMIPLLNGGSAALKDMMDKADRLGLTISKDFAEKANEFNDNLTIIKSSSDKLAISLGSNLVSALGDALAKMAEVTETSGKFKGLMAGLDAFGNKFLDWEGNAIRKQIKAAEQDIEHLRAVLAAPVVDIFGQKGEFEKQLADKLALLKKLTDEYYKFSDKAGGGRGFVNPASVAVPKQDLPSPGDPGIAAQYDALIKRISEKIALNEKEFSLGRSLTETEKVEAKALADLAQITKGANPALEQRVKLRLLELQNSEVRKQQQAQELDFSKQIAQQVFKENDEMAAFDKAREDHFQQINAQYDRESRQQKDSLAALGKEADLLGATDAERKANLDTLAIEQKLKETLLELDKDLNLTAERREQLRAQASTNADDAMQIVKAQKELSDYSAAWGRVDDIGKQVWSDLWTHGSNVLKDLGHLVKTALIDTLYQLVVKKWIFNIFANITGGASGLAGMVGTAGSSALGSAAGSSLGGSLFGGVGAAMSGGYAAGASGATAFATNLGVGGGTLGASGAAEMATTGALVGEGGAVAGVGSALSAGLAAIPVYGWIALAALAIYSVFSGSSHGPKSEGGFAPAGLDISGIDARGLMQGSQRGDVASAQTISQGISASYAALAQQLGLVNQKLDVGVFYAQDPNGTAQTQLQVVSDSYNRSTRLGGIENVARGDAGLQAALTEETTRVIFEALKQSNLSDVYKQWLNAVGTDAGVADMQAVIDHISKANTERQQLEATLFDLTATDLEKLTKTREAERAAVDDSNRALLEQIYTLQDQKTAADAAAQAAKDAADALATVREGLLSTLDSTKGAVVDAYGRESSALQQTIAAHRQYADTLRQFRDSLFLGDQSPVDGAAQTQLALGQFRREISKAQSGDSTANVQGTASAYLTALKQTAVTKEDYARGFAEVASGLTVAASQNDAMASIEQNQLDAMTSQVSQLGLIDTHVISLAEAIKAYLAALLAAQNGGAVPAMNAGDQAIADAKAYGAQYGGNAYYLKAGINDYAAKLQGAQSTADLLNSEGSSNNGQAWTADAVSLLSSGQSLSYWQQIQALYDSGMHPTTDTVPGHAGGLRSVPYDNYLMRAHYGEAVLNRSQAEDWRNGGSETKALLRELIAESRKGVDHAETTVNVLKRVTRDGESLVTVPA